MSKIALFLSLTVMHFSLPSYSQVIPKGAEAIEIKSTLPDSILFKRTIAYLNANDFIVNRSDPEYGTIITDPRASSGAMNMRILVNVKQGTMLFKGQWSAQLMGYSFTNEPVRNKGMVGSNEKKSFIILNNLVAGLAKELSNSTLDYILPLKK